MGDLADILSVAVGIAQALGWKGTYLTQREIDDDFDDEYIYLDCSEIGGKNVYVDPSDVTVRSVSKVSGAVRAINDFKGQLGYDDDFDEGYSRSPRRIRVNGTLYEKVNYRIR